MRANPTISVITATRNCRNTIEQCLASVAAQTWLDRQHIVVDGASSDGTLELLEAHRSQFSVLVSEPDCGIYDALNKGLAYATGEVVGFLHADDIYARPDVLALIAEAFTDPEVGAVYGDVQYVRKDDVSKVVRNWHSGHFSHRRLAWGWMPPHPSLYVRRSWYARVGAFETDYRISADYLSVLKLFSQPTLNAVYVPALFVKMRVGGASNRSIRNMIVKSSEDLNALRRTGVGGLGALVWKNISKLPQWL